MTLISNVTRAYYNEDDQFAAAVLREQTASGVIAPGDVDDRSVEEVTADDLKGYTQAHFFAGGGFWSIAARLAGWSDDKPLWTASCPCQPFSVAGKGRGTDDPRHLWPHLFRILRGAKASGFGPPHLVGEQVSGAAGYGWFDGVRADLAQEGYASRARDIPACAVDAPHQRNRLFWVALDDCSGAGLEGQRGDGNRSEGRTHSSGSAAEADDFLLPNTSDFRELQPRGSVGEQWKRVSHSDARNGSFWSDYEWIVSPLDGKARRAEPSIPFLVDGIPNRVGLWRIAGGAIVPQIAAEVLKALMETECTS